MKLMEFYSQFQKNEETESPQVSEETTEEIKT
jgi:hypothetical protein